MKNVSSQNGVATKKDLLSMEKRLRHDLATKDDLKSLVTKEEAKKFATKDDLKRYATKDELMGLEQRIDYRIDSKFQDYMEKLDAKLFEWKSQIFNLVGKNSFARTTYQ